jgi:hypothetical protein
MDDVNPAQTDDPVLAAAVELARAAAVAVGGDSVGDHLGVRTEGDRVVTHAFAASLPGYVGWHWAVSVARAPRSRTATVDERIQPGDLSPGELLPPPEDDPRLVPGYVLSDDPAVEAVAFELGVGRERVLSREGRLLAAERWHDGPHGPDTAMARQAPGRCGTCGFFVALAGSLQAGFGVCGNELTEADGHVVSVEYGCGAHSQARPEPARAPDVAALVYDDGEELTAR